MTPAKIVGALLVLSSIGALVQTFTAKPTGKKLALTSIRYRLEERARVDRDAVMKEAVAAKSRLKKSEEADVIFTDVLTVWLAREPSPDLTRPTLQELDALPTWEALGAVRKLTPDTGFEGMRIRSLFESRRNAPADQLPVLSKLIGVNPGDASAVRAYTAALRSGKPEERRKAVELSRDYVKRDEGSRLSRLTLLLALHASLEQKTDPEFRTEALALAEALSKEVPQNSSSAESVRSLTGDLKLMR